MGYPIIQLAFLSLILASSTCFSINLPSEYSILGNDLNELLSEERVIELFKQWQEKHKKVYNHAQEFEKRLENFRRSLKYVIEKNSKRKSPDSLTVGLNKFADLSNEEFKEMYMSKIKMPYGSCWAFSSTGAMEGINAIVNGELISLSEQELVDCDTSNYGCEGGYMDYAFEWVVGNGGIDSESDYPYTSVTGYGGTCNTTKETENKVVTIDGYEDVEQEESALLCATVNQPISVGIDGSAYDFQLYTSNAVCCTGTEYCCPSDYPICDVKEGLCLRNQGDYLGVAAKKRKMAKHKFPWTKIEETQRMTYQPLQWKRNQFAAIR
ncbi:Peptidase C1A, papain C-terminal [Dillenia turbinata]|uniref:Peptidase C1A, papain C-terminal n=1 Tax=Dillenia turbinata TaxID=194707 RepID=A0AAN8YZA2_9MAGN